MTPDRASAARDVLTFYVEAGVDVALSETANDYLSAPQPAAAASVAAAPPTVRAPARTQDAAPRATTPTMAPPAVPEAAVMAAREAARSAASLEDLRAILGAFDGCALKATATQLVFADGTPKSRLMFVGEAPGADEDRTGQPFIGASGQLFNQLLTELGISRAGLIMKVEKYGLDKRKMLK